MTRPFMRPGTFTSLLLALLVLSGCVGFTLVKGGEKTSVGSDLTVIPPHDWNRMSTSRAELWTLDGFGLEQIIFVTGATDGDFLYPFPGAQSADSDNKGLPVFRKNMNAIEITELVQATMARENDQHVKVTNLHPATFAAHRGLAFRFTYETKNGLAMEGTATGAVIHDKLYMAIYRGAKLYYYERGFPDFRKMLKTVRIDSTAS